MCSYESTVREGLSTVINIKIGVCEIIQELYDLAEIQNPGSLWFFQKPLLLQEKTEGRSYRTFITLKKLGDVRAESSEQLEHFHAE